MDNRAIPAYLQEHRAKGAPAEDGAGKEKHLSERRGLLSDQWIPRKIFALCFVF